VDKKITEDFFFSEFFTSENFSKKIFLLRLERGVFGKIFVV